jgi:ribonuclease-3
MAHGAAHQPHLHHRIVTETAFLEQALEHGFANHGLLTRALTHSSFSKDNYERLEFLGDRVLGLVIAEWLSTLYPQAEEGTLAKTLAALVSRDSLALVARGLGLGPLLKLSVADVAAGGRDNPSILADACEAVIAALYLDGGLDVARKFIRAHWREMIQSPPATGDAKTQLQEWTQGRGLGLPAYIEKGREGPDHAPSFVIEVRVQGLPPVIGTGPSKRVAERLAAEAMLAAVAS